MSAIVSEGPYVPASRISGIRAAMTYSPNIDRSALRGSAAVERMADDFRLICANNNAVEENDMLVLGWTQAQITLHGAAARQHALALAARQREFYAGNKRALDRSERRQRKARAVS